VRTGFFVSDLPLNAVFDNPSLVVLFVTIRIRIFCFEMYFEAISSIEVTT